MAPDFISYLATEIVSEQKTISYRNVARALKVHVNAAKCMLFDFYQKENKKKAGSIHATYVVAGSKKHFDLDDHEDKLEEATNGDAPPPSSPPAAAAATMMDASQATEATEATQATEQVPERELVRIKTISLCREEDLDSVKDSYDNITSIHIYSLSVALVEDLTTLTETGRAVIADYHSKQDPLIHNKDYGIIQNPHVWRRSGKRPINVNVPEQKVDTKPESKVPSKKQEEAPAAVASRPSSRDSTTTQDSITKAAKTKPSLKHEGSSLFKAFAKQSAKPKPERKDTDTSAVSDTKMGGMDDNDEGESEDEAMFLDTGTTKSRKRPADVRREEDERRAKLRKMMDDEAEEPEVPTVADAADMDAEPPAAKAGEDPDVPDGDGEDVAWSDSDTEKKSEEAGKQAPTEAGPKRRRGKRKVMKKVRTKDEDGFLVTREEEAWESFSEEEPEPARKVAFPPHKSSAPAGSQSQKGSAPRAPGGTDKKKADIASFFGKKPAKK